MQRLWNIITENGFLELESKSYTPAQGWADYFSYSLKVETSQQKNIVS